jgi:hypothetical protein
MSKKYAATSAMVENQSKGRALKKKKTARSYSSPYEMTAKSFNDELTLDDIKATYSFLVKQKEKINKYNVDTDGQATEAYLDWLDGGATAGLAFTTMILQDEGILKSVTKEVDEEELEAVEKSKWTNLSVQKAANEELMQVTFVAMVEGIDAHADFVDENEIRKAKESFNKSSMKCKMFHLWDTNGAEVIESFQSPVDFILNDRFISKGTWLMTFQIYDETLWKWVKDGTINGISIGAMAQCIKIEDDDESA